MTKSKLKNNFIYQVIYQIFILAIPFIMSPYVSRILGPEGLGTYSYTYSIAYYFVLVMMLGIVNYGNRTIAKCCEKQERLNKEFSEILTLHILLAIICTLFYFWYVFGWAENRLYALIQGIYVISGVFDITWFYQGMEKFNMVVMRNIAIKVITVALIFLWVKNRGDLWIYCLIMATSTLVGNIVLWLPLNKYIHFVIPKKQGVLKHLYPMFVLFLPTIAISLYKYMDKIMIGILSNKMELGYYENAENGIRILTSVLGALGTVMLPRMSNLVVNKNLKEFNKYISKSMYYLMIAAFAMSFGMAGIADVFAPLFWGDEFAISSKLIQTLAISVPFIAFANVIRTQFLLPNERDKEYTGSVISGALVNVVFNIILIPRFGALGAAVATVGAEVIVCVVQVIGVRKDLPIHKYLKEIVPFFVIGILEFFVVYLIPQTGIVSKRGLCLGIQVIVGVTVYCIPTLVVLYTRGDMYVVKIMEKWKK